MNSKMIQVQGSRFTDKEGHDFIPHGINMVCKDRTRDFIGDYKASDFAFLREHGFDLIRLGLQWCAAEPEPGIYSEEYFKGIDDLIRLSTGVGIPVILDMHQDLYGIRFEDGAPDWATFDDGAQHIRTELWSESYLVSPAVQHAFDNFWKDTPASDNKGIRTHYTDLWRYIADRYRDEPGVIGYDIMNEPFPGSPGAIVGELLAEYTGGGDDLSVFESEEKSTELICRILPVTSSFEEDILNPFYDEAGSAIRSVDPDTIIMLESDYFANAGIPSVIRPARYADGTLIPGQAYVPHGYDILVDTESYEQGGTERVDLIFGSILDKARSIGIPTLIGEWGCYPHASDAQKAQARHLLSLFAKAQVGQTYFDFSHIRDGGILEVLDRGRSVK